jgi:hypothetical protein
MSIHTPVIELEMEIKRLKQQREAEKYDKTIKDIAMVAKCIIMSAECNNETMNIINGYIEDIKNLYLTKGKNFDFLSNIADEDKAKMVIILVNLMVISTSKK